MKALIIDDEAGIRISLGHFLKARDYRITEAANGTDGIATARKDPPDLVFLDYRLPDCDGEELLSRLVSPEIGACVIMMTGYAEVDKAVRAIKSGAEYFFSKPLDLDRLTTILENIEARHRLQRDEIHYRKLSEETAAQTDMIGSCPQMLSVKRLISLLSRNQYTPVLILGESGTGKELVARSIHTQSCVTGQLVELNSAALPENLLEAELFGHEKGAFTDASRTKPGLFEVADKGTIFFDELADMPLAIQAKLLKVLDSKQFRRVGGIVDLTSSARFIGATNKNIVELVNSGQFRADLYYRINVIPINLPPLRERGDDIILLAWHFVKQIGLEMGWNKIPVAKSFMQLIKEYHWPGNVRELRNVIERALILADGKEVTELHLPQELRTAATVSSPALTGAACRKLKDIEDEHIRHAVMIAAGNLSRAAALLGISRSTLHLRLKQL